ncbi:phage terminase small subunit [Vagococcus hydrophili]|uniref:Small subunit of terminase n=1 Tax=Vagococcus hydrophili TaxID=2714947 RepID=A0A6G8AQ37_9ENTE|nr:phage terminase small subunit [Vagococcus hydrophili]QIL47045.1 small subunit of terminase [Vagococcus hydrophili]
MNEEIKEKALELYQKDWKYKDIAAELNISVNTFKSWVRRYGWTKNKGAPKQEKVHPKKVGPPKGSRNALGNSGGAAPKQNKNAVKTGEYETIYSEYLTDEEKSLFDKQVDSSLVLSQEIHLLRVRQLRMLKRLEQAENGLNDNEKSILYELRGRKTLIEAKGKKIPVDVDQELMQTEIQERVTRKIDDVLRIEEALTRVSAQLARSVKQYEEIDLIYARTRYTIAQTEKALLNNDRGKRGENDGEGQTIINIIDDIG